MSVSYLYFYIIGVLLLLFLVFVSDQAKRHRWYGLDYVDRLDGRGGTLSFFSNFSFRVLSKKETFFFFYLRVYIENCDATFSFLFIFVTVWKIFFIKKKDIYSIWGIYLLKMFLKIHIFSLLFYIFIFSKNIKFIFRLDPEIFCFTSHLYMLFFCLFLFVLLVLF